MAGPQVKLDKPKYFWRKNKFSYCHVSARSTKQLFGI